LRELREGVAMATHSSHLPGILRFAFGRPAGSAHRTRPPLLRGERVLVEERAEGSAPVVATNRALHHRGPEGWRRVPWEETGRVRWDAQRHVLELATFSGQPLELRLARPTRLPSVARERVAATVLVTTRVELNGTGCAMVTARSRPGTSQVVWIVKLDDGVDQGDPAVQAEVDSAIHNLRRHVGI
jgi:hypothetical protein